MASASELNIVVKGDDKASAMMNKLGQNAQRMGAQFQKAGVAMMAMGGAMVLALGKSVKDWAAAGDEVQKMSLRTNWAAESLSELRHVAEITGTELDAFEKGTRRMSQSIVDASDGLETYLRDFNKLGLDVNKLKAMKPEEAFWEIAYALGDMDNEIEQTNIAMGIFGRTGTQLLPMLSEGQAGIEALRLEAHELGIVFDEEAANAAASLTDAMHRVGEAINGVKFAMAEALAPSVEGAANKLQDLIVGIGNFIEKNPQAVQAVALLSIGLIGAGGLAIALGTVIRNITVLTGLLGGLTIGFTALAGAAGLAGGAIMAFGGYLLYQNAQIDAYNEKVAEIYDNFNKLNTQILSGTAQYNEEWRQAAGLVLAIYEQSKNLTAENIKQWDNLKKEVKTYDLLNQLAQAAAAGAEEIAARKADIAKEEEAALKAKIALQDEINEKAREQNVILHQQADILRQSWAEQDARLRGIAEGQRGGPDLSRLSMQGAADYWETTLNMLKSGTNLQFLGGVGLDFSLGQPSQANINDAIRRAEQMQGFYAHEAASLTRGGIDITLQVDGKVLAEVTSDNMGAMID